MSYEIRIERTNKSNLSNIDLKNIPFGRVFTDHMLISDYYNGEWRDTRIVPYGNLSLSPATTAFHYGQEIFEGLKAYRDGNGGARLFRPEANFERMNKSAYRMAMPQLPREIFMDGMRQLIQIDKDWIPTHDGSSLYIRPFMISTDEYVGIKPSDNYKFIIFCSPVNAYYSEPVRTKIEQKYVRAAHGGTGEAKAAANYAASLRAVLDAAPYGYKQMIWTDACEHKWIEEAGTMNVFFVIDDEVVTPALSGTILHGITRDSVCTLLRDAGRKISERKVSVEEVVEAARSGRLKEAFGAGTAATIAPMAAIGFGDECFEMPPVESMETANWLLERLNAIKYGTEPDKFGWIMEV